MPLFFFHHHGEDGVARDEVGCEFDTVELAYLEAFRSAVTIGAEMILEQIDPSRQRIEIVDRDQRHLADVCFDEIFRSRDPFHHPGTIRSKISVQIERNRRLRADIRLVCASARETLDAARRTLDRAGRSAAV